MWLTYPRVYYLLSRRNSVLQERERQRQEKEQHAQMCYMQKMQEEMSRKREAEQMIARLESEEKDLISRLRRTQDLQEKAYAVLQKSLRS